MPSTQLLLSLQKPTRPPHVWAWAECGVRRSGSATNAAMTRVLTGVFIMRVMFLKLTNKFRVNKLRKGIPAFLHSCIPAFLMRFCQAFDECFHNGGVCG
jgi:hypothetical protein